MANGLLIKRKHENTRFKRQQLFPWSKYLRRVEDAPPTFENLLSKPGLEPRG